MRTRVLTAASSIASGSPSSRRHSSTTAAWLAVVSPNVPDAAAALSVSSLTASFCCAEARGPAAPGGGWHQTARAMQRVLAAIEPGVTVQVDNVPGAAGTIGLARFIQSERGNPGALLVTAGDGASFYWTDYGQGGESGGITPPNPCGDPPSGVGGDQTPPDAEGGALRSQDVRSTGDPNGLDGAILRVDPATGAALQSNPYYGGEVDDDDSVAARVWTEQPAPASNPTDSRDFDVVARSRHPEQGGGTRVVAAV